MAYYPIIENGEQVTKELTRGLATNKVVFLYHLPGMEHSFVRGLEEQWGPQASSRTFIDSIDHWAQDDHTWEDVCEACETTGNKHLANELRKKYLIRKTVDTDGETTTGGNRPAQLKDQVQLKNQASLDYTTSDETQVLTSDNLARIQIKYGEATERVNAFFSHGMRDLQKEKEKVQDEIEDELKKLKGNQRKVTTATHGISDLKNNLETYEKQVKTALEQLEVGDYRQAYRLRYSQQNTLLEMGKELESIENELTELKRAIPTDLDSISTPTMVMNAIGTTLKLKLEPIDDFSSIDDEYVEFKKQ